jgi:hypothetical protein
MKNILPGLIMFLVLLLAACANNGNPQPKDFLKEDEADIFLFEDIVYSNAEDLDWVAELTYSLGEEAGEITSQSDRPFGFKNGTANKLPAGTKIYETDTPIMIAIVEGKEIPYLAMIEG